MFIFKITEVNDIRIHLSKILIWVKVKAWVYLCVQQNTNFAEEDFLIILPNTWYAYTNLQEVKSLKLFFMQ